ARSPSEDRAHNLRKEPSESRSSKGLTRELLAETNRRNITSELLYFWGRPQPPAPGKLPRKMFTHH
ncbi:MAG TPA: hypothetical protein VFO39_04420, partial [Candidatus Sulfotelmatobacter sp.]|nr:hypothetical protein [Candidatus Sulfotelmatobacter sp.]